MAEFTDEFEGLDEKEQRQKLKEEKKRLAAEEKESRKERKKRRRELSEKEADLETEDVGSGFATFLITLLIILMWLAIMALLVKLDVGGFGSQVLAPVIGKVPVLNRILPESALLQLQQDENSETGITVNEGDGTTPEIILPGFGNDEEEGVSGNTDEESGGSGGAGSAYIRQLENELAEAQQRNNEYAQMIAEQQAEVNRLAPFEEEQQQFEEVKADFYEQVIYAENGPGPEEYMKYYEGIDPELAAELYQEAVKSYMDTEEVRKYAQTYASMKAKKAAGIMEDLVNNKGDAELAARILKQMSADDRGSILGAMEAEPAGVVTQLLEPDTLPGLN
ncbi:MAG: hypothetical protein K6C95_09670 [Lachnospiraceae bacterium]|nr:hypothetical protein [Lachnospiraceae bacterium]